LLKFGYCNVVALHKSYHNLSPPFFVSAFIFRSSIFFGSCQWHNPVADLVFILQRAPVLAVPEHCILLVVSMYFGLLLTGSVCAFTVPKDRESKAIINSFFIM